LPTLRQSGLPPITAGRPVVAFDAPTTGEWAVWWATPTRARFYTATVVVLALVTTLVAALRSEEHTSELQSPS